jgi:hypothetical protein
MRSATTPHGKLMITVSGGRVRTKASGVRFGRKAKRTKHQREEALARRAAGEALPEIGRSYNVSHSTISRLGSTVLSS